MTVDDAFTGRCPNVLKKLICLVAALCLCLVALAEDGGAFPLRFDEGFTLSLPEGWVSYPPGGGNTRYALGDGSGQRFLYILGQETELRDFDALRVALGQRSDCEVTSTLDLNGQPFAAFIAPQINASGCSTLLNGEILTFLFTPQDDQDYMVAVAEIMGSFKF